MPDANVVVIPNTGYILCRRIDTGISIIHVDDRIGIIIKDGDSHPGNKRPSRSRPVIFFNLMV
ncbi:hypothetical protein ES707_18787 [subsurface metagenome]